MPDARRSRAALLLAAFLLTGPGCIVFFSTGPTHVEDATIVFLVKDDFGHFVAHVHVEVIAVASDWHTVGSTSLDGAFRCRVQGGVERIRVGVTPPEGFAFSAPGAWPRTIEVAAGEEETVPVLLRRLR